MKKIALLLALLMIPCSAFGLEMLNDNALDEVTGQSGVGIAFDDIQLFLHVDKFAYIDCDGYSTNSGYGGTCAGSGAAIVIENFQMDTININMIGTAGSLATFEDTQDTVNAVQGVRGNQTTGVAGSLHLNSTSCGLIPLFYDYGTGASIGCQLEGVTTTLGLNNYTETNPQDSRATWHPQGITIDITNELPLMTAGLHAYDPGTTYTVAGVLIGLPTAEFYIHSMQFTPRVDDDITTVTRDCAKNDDESFGTFYIEGITFSTFGGWMEIAPTGTPGDGL